MGRKKTAGALTSVEILHVDAAGSRQLYVGFSAPEKSFGQRVLRSAFEDACRRNGGRRSHWAGDGGFAIFRSATQVQIGAAVRAGKEFLLNRSQFNAQAARALGKSSFAYKLRIKAHRGEVFLGSSKEIDSAEPRHFDDFLKGEKKFAPVSDELFITGELMEVLPYTEKQAFELFKKNIKSGTIHTKLYRLKTSPVTRSQDILKHGDEVDEISEPEWKYLRTQIHNHYVNVSARNQITKTLIAHLETERKTAKRLLPSDVLLSTTLEVIVTYLRIAFGGSNFRVTYWRAIKNGTKTHLKKIISRSSSGEVAASKARSIDTSDETYKLCQAFATLEPVATPSVAAERLQKGWTDFDPTQSKSSRGLMSALQIPIYVEAKSVRRPVGVLSLDGDKPDTFLPVEVDLWRDELVGFLANLALAEILRERQNGG